VRYSGQTGNQLFQYAFARLLAEYRQCPLNAGHINMFPELHGTAWWQPRLSPLRITDLPQFCRNDGTPLPDAQCLSLDGIRDITGVASQCYDRDGYVRDALIC